MELFKPISSLHGNRGHSTLLSQQSQPLTAPVHSVCSQVPPPCGPAWCMLSSPPTPPSSESMGPGKCPTDQSLLGDHRPFVTSPTLLPLILLFLPIPLPMVFFSCTMILIINLPTTILQFLWKLTHVCYIIYPPKELQVVPRRSPNWSFFSSSREGKNRKCSTRRLGFIP